MGQDADPEPSMSPSDWPRDNAELVAQLTRQRNRYEQLVANMSDLLMLIAPDGTVTFSNRRNELPPGGAAYPPVGAHALNYLAERDRQGMAEALEDVLTGRASARNVLFRIRAGSGTERIIEGTITPVTDDGKVVQLEFLGRDVTERQQAAEALRQANLALRRRQEDLQRDLDVAAKIHASLLPAAMETDSILIDLKHVSPLGVGGDYVYIHKDDPLRPSLAIFDVSGHGVASALVASRVHSAVYAIMAQGDSPPEMIARLNRFIYESFADLGVFVTLFGMQLDLQAGTACYCGAGHPPALLRKRGAKEMIALESAHLPIGVDANIFVGQPTRSVRIAPGDDIWLYTDGLMELRRPDGEILGIPGLMGRLGGFDLSNPAPGVAEQCLGTILADFESPDDDVTLMLAAIK